MSRRHAARWIALFIALVAASGALRPLLPGGEHVMRGSRMQARVTRVVDGDTVKVSIGGRRDTVRYIGMDTPETKKPGTPIQCFGKAASARNESLVAGARVTLRTDAESRDRYGRLLAYVFRDRDGLFVNAALVREGFATTLTIPPNVAHASELHRLERRARAAGRGLWRACDA